MPKIYTKTGDRGETGLIGGKRVRKDHPRIDAYGEVDELNAMIGLIRSSSPAVEIDRRLEKIQNDLFEIGAVLAASGKGRRVGGEVSAADIAFLEETIDTMEAELPPLKNFILPGGGGGARLHLARTFCRRAERRIVALSKKEGVDKTVLAYMNRLSDFLFVLARWINAKEGVPEKRWEKK